MPAAIGSEFVARSLKPWVAVESVTVQALALVLLFLVSGNFNEKLRELIKETKGILIK
jgi:hypothetical protein